MKKIIPMLALVGCLSLYTHAQTSGDKFWAPVNESGIQLKGKRQIIPQKYVTFKLNGSDLKDKLFAAPNERSVAIEKSSCIISLPLPNGKLQNFWVVESPIMEQGLAAQYPNMKTFSVKGIDDAYASGKLDWNEFGFHGMVRTPNGDFFIDPYCVSDLTDYISYYTADFVKDPSQQIPEAGVITNSDNNIPAPQKKSTGSVNSRIQTPAICVGSQLRTYRLAIACTGEYAVAATGQSAPTVAQTLSKIQTSINRVDGVYETEVAVRMVLIATETLVIFTDPNTDPFQGNNNANTLINESHTVITATIGSANFDIGHTFSTGGGGLAYQGCVCVNTNKGRGITGSPSPVGDAYDIDYVAHEMGHQFGGSHTFNAITGSCTGNRNASTSVEPGSGVTIMAYAGICGANDNLANHSIPYFHAISYDELVNYTNSGSGNNCAVIAPSPSTAVNTTNLPPVVAGSGDFTIPKLTPFTLTGSATDPDGDAVTYSWEETDPGSGSGGTWSLGTAPFFRSYAPLTTATRLFPNAVVLASGNYTFTRGEVLPNAAQTLNFRLTARDNRMGGGGVCYAENVITVDDAGPFTVTYPSATGIVWVTSTQNVVTWDVNVTDQGAISCDSVQILISYNNNQTYSVLVSSTPNDGTETITVPTVSASITTCRIKVIALGNIFYDIGNSNFSITTDVGINALSQNNPVGLAVWPNPFNDQFNFAASSLNSSSHTQLSVMDVLGKVVLQADYASRSELKETIDLSGMSPGIYFIKVSNDHKQSVYRVVKN
jgi:hypothetical protein